VSAPLSVCVYLSSSVCSSVFPGKRQEKCASLLAIGANGRRAGRDRRQRDMDGGGWTYGRSVGRSTGLITKHDSAAVLLVRRQLPPARRTTAVCPSRRTQVHQTWVKTPPLIGSRRHAPNLARKCQRVVPFSSALLDFKLQTYSICQTDYDLFMCFV